MGRRYEHSSREFDELVLSNVEKFLKDKPANELSLRKLAGLINYAPSTLVSVYGNYTNLLLRVNGRTLDTLNKELSACYELKPKNTSPDHFKQIIQQLALTYYNFAQKHTHRWQLIYELNLPKEESLPKWMHTSIDYAFELLVNCLSRVNHDKSEKELLLASRILWASVHGITQLSIDDKLFLNQDSSGIMMIMSLLDNFLSNWAITNP